MNREDAFQISKDFLGQKKESFSQEQMEKLGELIQFHSELYYEKEHPVISDSEYDALFKLLEYLEEKYRSDVKVSHSVGSTGRQSSFGKVPHSRPMISLDNTYNADELRDFDMRIKRILKSENIFPYTLEFKFDGLGIELIYEDGVLLQAITRGNGIEGEDVTENVKQIKNIPHRIVKKWRFEVRGEVVMPISSFERLNEQAKQAGEKLFSNPRNAASGSLRVLDTSITKKRDLKYFAYDVSDFSEFSQWKYSDMIHYLESLGFEISSYFPKCQGIEEVIATIETIWDIKKNLDFEIDGLVIKINDISLWKKVGSTEHHPRYAIAYKFPAEICTTKIVSIDHQVGKTGTITPVANLEEVSIGGAMIRRATLHNYEEIEKLWVEVWDRVFIKRAGEVIPKIISVAVKWGEGLWKISPPKHCPSCGSVVKKEHDKVRYFCDNPSCPAQVIEKLVFAVGKQGFNIDSFGEKQVRRFFELGFIRHFPDIFLLSRYRKEILALEWFQEISVNKILSELEKAKDVDMARFLTALSIPGVGKKTAKNIKKYLIALCVSDTAEDRKKSFLSAMQEKIREELLFDELEALPDIWPEIASNIVTFFSSEENMKMLHTLDTLLHIRYEETNIQTGGKYTAKKMCITGSFEGYTRDALIKILEEQWGQFVSTVSKKTDYLLAGEKAGSKLKKAQELGVEVLCLEEFLNI